MKLSSSMVPVSQVRATFTIFSPPSAVEAAVLVEAASEEAATELAAAEEAVEAEPPQAVMPTASARAAAAIATVLSFIGIISFFFFFLVSDP